MLANVTDHRSRARGSGFETAALSRDSSASVYCSALESPSIILFSRVERFFQSWLTYSLDHSSTSVRNSEPEARLGIVLHVPNVHIERAVPPNRPHFKPLDSVALWVERLGGQ